VSQVNMIGPLALIVAGLIGSGVATGQIPAKPSEPKPVEPVKEYIVFVNLNERAELLVPGKEPMKDLKGIEKQLGDEIATQKAKAGGNVDKVVVIIRAPSAARFGDVIGVMELCIKAGAKSIQLRVRILVPDEK
jgi:biopolymer transport protein ExbD